MKIMVGNEENWNVLKALFAEIMSNKHERLTPEINNRYPIYG